MRQLAWLETLLVFLIFFIQGAYPVPDVNEPNYLGKAIHYWNPAEIRGDFFLDSADAHWTFYFAFGWLSRWLTPTALAWTGRVLVWALLAWGWQRLTWAAVGQRWFAVLTAAMLACLLEQCHMAGEWVIGGVEAKGFAFVLVFLALDAVLRDRWNRACLLLGAATAFHPLVGGWPAVAVFVIWLAMGRDRPPLRSYWPGLLGGAVLSLAGILPVLSLTWGQPRELVAEANCIYVYERLPHHLNILQIRPGFVTRFLLLTVIWLLLCRLQPASPAAKRLRIYVATALVVWLMGAGWSLASLWDPTVAASVLRYYWFRLADVAVPLGIAIEAARFIHGELALPTRRGWCWLGLAAALTAVHLAPLAVARLGPQTPRADRLPAYQAWRDVCEHVARSPDIPPTARFLVPRLSQTFKWYARRPEVAVWKELPQDAAGIVEWWRRMRDLHATGSDEPNKRWYNSLAEQSPERLEQLGQKYGAEYLLTTREPSLPFAVVYENEVYRVYRLSPPPTAPLLEQPAK